MKTYKAYKFRLYPTDSQKLLIEKTFRSTIFIYNTFLAERKNKYELNKIKINKYDQLKELTVLKKEYEWLKEIDSCALQTATFNLDDAFVRFFSGYGYPKFKKKNIHDSYRTNNVRSTYKDTNYESIRIDLKNKLIALPKLKEVKIRGYRNLKVIPGKVKSATVSKDAGKYYVSVLVEVSFTKPVIDLNNVIGLDLGIKDFIVTSDGEKIKNEVKMNEKRLKGLQKGLSRCVPGSKNYNKMKLKIQRLYLKIRNSRKYMIHTVTNKILKDNDIIAVESLDIKEMYQVHKVAKYLNQVPMGEFLRILKYKAEWLGKKVIEINKYYPSSQICNRCNYKEIKVKDLSVRSWICKNCECVHDRDINASINIMFEGLTKYIKENLI